MDLYDAQLLAMEQMTKHGLIAKGWTFKWDRSKTRFGICYSNRKQIGLSMPLSKLQPEREVMDTILHEIAHALVGAGHGHDLTWKKKCLEVGARPKRCGNENYTEQTAVWKARCAAGHEGPRRHRAPTDLMTCGLCARLNGVRGFTTQFLFQWYKNDRLVPDDRMPEKYRACAKAVARRLEGR